MLQRDQTEVGHGKGGPYQHGRLTFEPDVAPRWRQWPHLPYLLNRTPLLHTLTPTLQQGYDSTLSRYYVEYQK